MNEIQADQLRLLPKVQLLLETEEACTLIGAFSRQGVLVAIRGCLDAMREAILNGKTESFTFSADTFFGELRATLEGERRRSLRRVINGTGIVIHTNLGRAPLAKEAVEALVETASAYSNLELDLETGNRGSRYSHVDSLLCRLTGAEAAVVVNNNAAAVTLALGTLAKDGEVVVSRGELIEIGGSFRIPEVIVQSGARLVEVGATNRTRIADYEGAITDDARLLMKVHPSNYRIVGFTGSASREELVALGREYGLAVVEDLGSGTLVDLTQYGLPHEDTVQEVLDAGVDLVTFSGDKLLGGPQAGIVLGRKSYVERMKLNPLIRAFRIDKLSLAALEATLRLYLDPERLTETLPLLNQLSQGEKELKRKAARLQRALKKNPGLVVRIEDGLSYSGGGSLPGEGIPTKLVNVQASGMTANRLSEALRGNDPPVVGRVADDCVVLDLRTVTDEEIPEIVEAFKRILS